MKPPAKKSILLSVFAGLMLLYGVWNAGLGGVLIWGGANLMNEPGDGWGFLAQIIGVFVLLIGIPLLLFGLLAGVTSIGLFRRARWAQIFAFIVMSITLIWGVTSMTIGDPTDGVIVYGVAHLVFAILGIVLLILRGDEFSSAFREYGQDYDRMRGSFAID